MHAAATEHGGRVSVTYRADTSESSRQTANLNRHTPKIRTIDLLSWRQHSLSKGLAGMTTQQQIDIEFDSLARENDSPKLIANSKATGGTLLSVIKEQLSTCSSFDFCVAFVADGGLQILVEAFQELKQRGIKGRLLTSTYLNFNSPDAFRKLLEYDNIEVRVFQGNLHAKGYIFDKGETSTIIVGSSNMTQTALTCNKEWNVLYQTVENSRLLGELRGEFNSLWSDASTVALSQDWIDKYAAYRSARPPKPKSKPTFQATVSPTTNDLEELKPNKMQ